MSRPGNASADDPEPRFDAVRDWFGAEPESEGFPYFLAVLRSHLWFIVVTVIVCVGVATLYLTQVEKVYQSHADILITPVPRDNETLIGLGLPRESSDPTRDVETVARLIETPAVARRVVGALGLDLSARQLLADVDATPVASSNVVSVTARANDPELAARIANAFGNAGVADRTDRMYQQLDVIIPQLRRQIARLGAGEPGRDALVARLRDLEAQRSLQDPTLHLETRATPNSDPVAPRGMLSIAAAILAGLIIGGAAALGSELFDRRLRRDEQLRRYRIPILARVPFDGVASSSQEHSPLAPGALAPATQDAFRLAGASLSGSRFGGDTKRSVLVTGPNRGDGKTTAALNLAAAMTRWGRVVLVETDAEHPALRRSLRLSPKYGVTDVLAGRIRFSDALVRAESQAPSVELLVPLAGETPPSLVATPRRADWLIREAHLVADWLVVDAPPLAVAPDALSLAKQVDHVVLVVRLGNTRLKTLEGLAGFLVQQGIRPAGFVLIAERPVTASVRSWVESLKPAEEAAPSRQGGQRRIASVLQGVLRRSPPP